MSTQAQDTETLNIVVDGRTVEARKGEMVIAAAERAGIYIPRFCWHPRMKAVGMCRMCVVEISSPKGMMLMPSCYIPVEEGQQVVTTSAKAKKVQDGVLEFLLINHPLDCPVCDRGGECPLQDQTFAFGPGESRFVEEKRHWAKPIPINSLVDLDRERCIQCARCTRFADEVAGDPMIDFVGRADQTEINTFPDKPFISNFSGNIVQICPVGALLAKPYRFKARPWDLEVVESTCTACAVGCRVAVQSSRDRLIRNLGIDSEPVNHGWLCDKGRFSYEASEGQGRLTVPLVRRGEELVETSWNEALQIAAEGLRHVRDVSGPRTLALLGGARLPNEDAYAWAKLAKAVLGTDNVDCQLGDGLPAEVVLGLPRATIDETCRADAVLLLGPDIKEELPVLYLRLREAALEGGVPLVEVGPRSTGLSRYAASTLLHRPGEAVAVARALVDAVAGLRDPNAVAGLRDPNAVAGLRDPNAAAGRGPAASSPPAGVPPEQIEAAADLLRRGSVVVVLGRPSVAESAAATTEAAAVLAAGLPDVRFLPALRRGNVHGALDMGLAPGVLPGRVSLHAGRPWFSAGWGSVPEGRGLDALGIAAAAAANRIQGMLLVGADPVSDLPDRTLARRALAGVGFTVVVDTFLTDSALHADVVLPVAGWAERPGTTTNQEGRVTRLGQKVTAPGTVRPDWMIAAELAERMGADLGFESLDSIAAEIEALAPSHRGLTPELLARRGLGDGVVVPLPAEGAAGVSGADLLRPHETIEVKASRLQGETVQPEPEPEAGRAPLQPGAQDSAVSAGHVVEGEPPALVTFAGAEPTPPLRPIDAYSLRLVASRSLYDAGVLVQRSPALAALAPGSRFRANPHDLSRLGIRPGDWVRVTSGRAALVLEAAADDGVPRGSAVVDFNQPGEGAADLIDATAPVTDVRVETVGAGAPAPGRQ
ncbi:MAG TPA: NADH-quinone oxidoreductase subunit NuoG [Acidimicrobiales bacterium]|nr:NADH-quinone oxidoreductase subunit NuoG [Acidimicrobiales bacterium]